MKISFLIILLVFAININAQSLEKSLFEISISTILEKQDRRLFDLPRRVQEHLLSAPEKLDYGFFIQVNKELISTQLFSGKIGIGYNKDFENFTRPFNGNYFTGKQHKLPYQVDLYVKDRAYVDPSISFNLIRNKKVRLAATMKFPVLYTFRKSAYNRGRNTGDYGKFEESIWKFEFDAIEFRPGLSLTFKKNHILFLNYRQWNYRKLDEVLFYLGSYQSSDEYLELRETGLDHVNPFNIMIGYTYKFMKRTTLKQSAPLYKSKQ